jgi:phosphatidylinositol-3,4,5-trisphosphate 3-phosphatase and dual-specificity protein phosphatase PTEN
MACSYLLTLDRLPSAPQLERSHTTKEWARRRAEDVMNVVPDDVDVPSSAAAAASSTPTMPTTAAVIPNTILESDDTKSDDSASVPTVTIVESPQNLTPASTLSPSGTLLHHETSDNKEGSTAALKHTHTLKHVLDLHTSRRMKSSSKEGAKQRQGVSIPSQRRWLHYWALILSSSSSTESATGTGSSALALAPPYVLHPTLPKPIYTAPSLSAAFPLRRLTPKVKLREIRVVMRQTGRLTNNIVKIANAVIDRTALAKGGGAGGSGGGKGKTAGQGHAPIWVSVARYEDDFVETLERWERYTRQVEEIPNPSGGGGGVVLKENFGRRQRGTEECGEDTLRGVFKDGRWDKGKMVRSFARMGIVKEGSVQRGECEQVGVSPLIRSFFLVSVLS